MSLEPGNVVNGLVVGLGSPHGDDQLGWLVVDRVADRLNRLAEDSPQVMMLRSAWQFRRALVPADLLDWLPGPRRLVLIDACAGLSLDEPWRKLDSTAWESLATRAATGHLIGLPSVLKLANQLGQLPHDIELWAIRGEVFEPGSTPSEAAVERANQLAACLTARAQGG